MGKTVYLYFGRGKGYEGFWLGQSQVPSSLRKKDQFLEYLRKHLSGARLLGLELDPEDRILYISYQKFGQECRLGLFYNGRKMYFANLFYNQKTSSMQIFRSWKKGETSEGSISDAFLEVGKKNQDKSVSSKKMRTIEELLLEEEKEALKSDKQSVKEKKFLSRKARNIEGDLSKTKKWPLLKEWLESRENLESLGMKAEVAGVKIKFREKTHFKRRDEVYEKIKKMKRGQKIQEARLHEANLAAQGKASGSSPDVAKSILEIIKPVWSKNTQDDSPKTSVEAGGYKVFSEDGVEIGVGLTAKGNDQLRKVWAKKTDWWFHLDSETSAHVIVKTSDGIVSPGLIEKVAKHMKKTSQADGEELNLIYTQVKNLKGVAGSPGAVTYKKEKRVRVYTGNLAKEEA